MNLEVLGQVQAHAIEQYPRECCGLLVEVAGTVEYVPCLNLAATPSEHFVLDPEAYADAEDRGVVLAVVHSHPDASAEPSDADRVGCEASGLIWHIVSVGKVDDAPEAGDVVTIQPSGYVAPLVGRAFAHGVLDCYTLVRDFYDREMGIALPDFERRDLWWETGADLYVENMAAAGFAPITGEPRKGDVILMGIRSNVANHAGVYLGNGLMLHHLHRRLSERAVYGGYWADHTRLIIRHQDTSDAG